MADQVIVSFIVFSLGVVNGLPLFIASPVKGTLEEVWVLGVEVDVFFPVKRELVVVVCPNVITNEELFHVAC